MSDKRLEIKKKWREAAKVYNQSDVYKMHALIIGDKGVGKTSLLATCPKPIVVFSFDPMGTLPIRDLEASGDALVYRFEEDDYRNPSAYINFERTFNELAASGLFEEVGTVALDSITTLADYAINQIVKKEGRIPSGMDAKTGSSQGMRIQDWGTFLRVYLMWSTAINTLPCHSLMFGHISREKDEVFGGFHKSLMLPGQASNKVPNIVPEVYYLLAKDSGDRYLLTNYDKDWKASTKLGKDKFDKEEKPNIKLLLKKAGLSYEDKPSLMEDEKDEIAAN